MRRRREIDQCLPWPRFVVVLLIFVVVAVTIVESFSVGHAGGRSSFRTSSRYYWQPDHHRASSPAAAAARRTVRLAAEAKNASEISHETLAAYREKLSIIPRTNGDNDHDDEKVSEEELSGPSQLQEFVTSHSSPT